MTTLIAVYNSEGCVGRCDAKCYEASHPECQCICGGANHGAGLDQAVANTQEIARQWIERYTREHDLEAFWWAEVPALEPVQLDLPFTREDMINIYDIQKQALPTKGDIDD